MGLRKRTRGQAPPEQVLTWYQHSRKRTEALESLYRAYAQEPAVAELAADARLVCGTGMFDAKVMLVGEAPGRNEDRTGKPFVGAAGKVLDNGLQSVGLRRDKDTFITNVVKFRPPDNREPTLREDILGRQYLLAEFQIVKPRLIVPLGKHALTVIDSTLRISQCHGRLFYGSEWTYFPMYHPAATLYNPTLKDMFLADFQALKEVLDELPEPE